MGRDETAERGPVGVTGASQCTEGPAEGAWGVVCTDEVVAPEEPARVEATRSEVGVAGVGDPMD